MDHHDGILLVVGSGLSAYREYLMSSAARRARAAGHDLWLINGTTPTWQRPYLAGWTVTNVHDHDNLAATARKLAGTRPVVGVLCWDEPLVLPSAMIAAELEVPGLGTDGVLGCRDKDRTRRLLRAAGLAQPAHGYATSVEQARTLAASIGYPVVVKPRALGASIGVVLATDQAQLDAAYRVAADASLAGDQPYQGGALIEEYLDGPEISVDGAVVDGDHLPMYLARKQIGLEPYFEEVGHVVDAADPLLADPALRELLAVSHRVLGIGFGMTHTEVKLTARGPVIVEVNGRLGGDLIPYLGKLATGIDPGEVMVEVALGVRPRIAAGHRSVAGIRFGYPPYDCRVAAVSVPRPDPSAGIVASAAMVGPGTELRLPPGGYIARHSFVVCAAADPDSLATRLREATDRVRLEAEPLAPPPVGAPFQMPAGLLDVEDDASPEPSTDTVREER
ncbi:ATP-grasp domain-containing protein [Micromonospora sp. CPCC 205561]|uniref:ATP-grasp domain-containing protein n=1 Tax=Micromonospora sp. CPCC 205561 TaxID=3122407 RepID=UPI002FF3960F